MLSSMEKVETDGKDTPLEEIRIDKVVVFVDPFEEADRQVCGGKGTCMYTGAGTKLPTLGLGRGCKELLLFVA